MGDYFTIRGNDCLVSFADRCMENKEYQSYFIHKTYQAATCIQQQGTVIEHFGIVTKGILKAVNDTVNGMELCHTYFQVKDIFPEFLYFSGKQHYTFDLYALKKSEVVWIPVTVMEEMLAADPQLMYALILYISHRGLKNQLFLNCLNYHTIRERIAFWIVGMNDLTLGETLMLPSSQSILANMLHVSRSSLNKELKLMERDEFFIITQREICDIDLGRLSELL